MRRTRLETTAYGDVVVGEQLDEGDRPPVAESAEREERWTIRRSSLSKELVLDAQALFAHRLGREVSENEARNLLGNLSDYIWMLVRWKVQPTDSDPTNQAPAIKRGRPAKAAPKRRRKTRSRTK